MSSLLSPLEVENPRSLAARLRELDLPGQRSMTAITNLRRVRSQRRPASQPRPSLAARLAESLTRRYTAEVARRGGETGIETGGKASALHTLPLAITDRRDGMLVLHVEGWRYYSRRFGSRRAGLSYLCGHDDAGDWAVRIPGTVTTVTEALAWITPAAVRQALAAGRRVARQGDIYAIATTKKTDAPSGWVGDDWRTTDDGQRTSHHWDAANRILSHHPRHGRAHAPLHLPHPVRLIQQRTYAHGRGGVWGAGD